MRAIGIILACAVLASTARAEDQKVIQDRAEYAAYMQALNTADPAAKAQAMEAFTRAYPSSVMLADALEQELAAWQSAGDLGAMERTARRLLEIQPDNVRVLAVLSVVMHERAISTGDPNQADAAGALADRGLAALPAWTPPEGLTQAQVSQLRLQMTAMFDGAIGLRALEHKDYARARRVLQSALQAQPNDAQNAYMLAIADVATTPVDAIGFWWGARAQALQPAAIMKEKIAANIRPFYRKYHGVDDDWDALVAQAATQTAPPPGFAVLPAAATFAVKALRENKVDDLSWSDWEFILAQAPASPSNKAAADQVWMHIQALQKQGAARLKIPVKVVSLTPNGFWAAVAEDSRKSGKADLRAVLKPGAAAPAVGAEVQVVGILVSYSPSPFEFVMEQAELAPK